MSRAACIALLAVLAVWPARGEDCAVSLLVLGVAQDGGKPQIANPGDAAWRNRDQRRLASSLALIARDEGHSRRYLFDATPDIKRQLQALDRYAPVDARIGLDGVFLTHAHIGHYTGLMLLGHEAAGARDVPVYAMPRMARFLRTNGPWEQLIRYRNIALRPLRSTPRSTSGDISSRTSSANSRSSNALRCAATKLTTVLQR